ncbi:MAG: hypothetical protein MZV65_14970 [Chromatiales bacterium]|nr:hypothetical protein [Chromatiales bacterium]
MGAVMTHWYLGTPNDNILTITQTGGPWPRKSRSFWTPLQSNPLAISPWPALVAVTQTVNPGTALILPVTLQALDGVVARESCNVRRTPIPAVPIAVDIVIADPTEAAAIAAEEAVAKTQAALDAFCLSCKPGRLRSSVEGSGSESRRMRDTEKCATLEGVGSLLWMKQKIAAVEARTVANLAYANGVGRTDDSG